MVRTADTVATVAIVVIYLSLLVAINLAFYRKLRRKNQAEANN